MLSPEAETLEVLQPREGRLATTALLKEGHIAPLHFPEAAIDIASIWPARK